MTDEIFAQYGDDPLRLFASWFEDARTLEPNDPDAMCLATSTPDGRPSNRMVLLKEFDETGFKFHTNAQSRKGEELLANPHAALCFYWKSTRRQIRIEGTVSLASDAEADDYFSTRPRERQIGAWASRQSHLLESRKRLEEDIKAIEQQYQGTDDIPRPDYWRGFRLHPISMEFWISHLHRLHERFIYTRNEDGTWSASWLYP